MTLITDRVELSANQTQSPPADWGRKQIMKILENTKITYTDNSGDTITGRVVGHDDHLRVIVQKIGAGKFDSLAIVSDEVILTVGGL